jgi:hypothetical protein
MKILLYISLIFVLSCNSIIKYEVDKNSVNYIYWDTMSQHQKDSVLSTYPESDKYLLKLNVKNNDADFDNLNMITNCFENGNSHPRELCFFVFNSICEKSDGQLSEVMGMFCMKVLMIDPNYVLNYFRLSKSMQEKYANFMGYEFYFKEEGTSTIQYSFSKYQKMIFEKLDEEYKKDFSNLCMKIEDIMQGMD